MKDHVKDKLTTLKFALEAFDKDDRTAIKQEYEELLDEVQKEDD